MKVSEQRIKEQKDLDRKYDILQKLEDATTEKDLQRLNPIYYHHSNGLGFGTLTDNKIRTSKDVQLIMDAFPVNGDNYERRYAGRESDPSHHPIAIHWANPDRVIPDQFRDFRIKYPSGDVEISIIVQSEYFGEFLKRASRSVRTGGTEANPRYKWYSDYNIIAPYRSFKWGGVTGSCVMYYEDACGDVEEWVRFIREGGDYVPRAKRCSGGKISDCCSAHPILDSEDLGICTDCKEHCEYITNEEES